MEIENKLPVVLNGGQASCKVEFCEARQEYLFYKTFHSKAEYQKELEFFQTVIAPINNEKASQPFIPLYLHDDYTATLAFPFLKLDLFKVVACQKGLSFKNALYYFTQIVQSVILLHEKGTVHNDIKHCNVLLDFANNFAKCYLIDFGHCKILKSMKEMSQEPCGTKSFNPYKLNQDIQQKEKNPNFEISEYSPVQLDVFQLGMLFATLLSPKTIEERNKLLFNNPAMQEKFFTMLEINHKSAFNKPLSAPKIVKDLIWRMLTGDIKHVSDILTHDVYNSELGKSLIENIKKTEQEDIFQHFYVNLQSGSDQRSDTASTRHQIEKTKEKYQIKKNGLCNDIVQFEQLEGEFLKHTPKEIDEAEIPGMSTITEISKEDLFIILMLILGTNNEEILVSNDIYTSTKASKGQGVKIIADQFIRRQEFALKDDIDISVMTDDDDNYDVFTIVEVERRVKMSVEIVTIKGLNKRTLLFELIEGDKTDFSELVENIEEEIRQFSK